MGTLFQKPPFQIQDLKVTIHNSSLVFPCDETERKSMFLSNIDQVLNFLVQTVHFFPARSHFPADLVAKKIQNALEKLLVSYDFMAGRLKMNQELGRLEIDCNAAGAGFVLASSEFKLDEIGDLVYPNPGFGQLIVTSLDSLPPNGQPLCIFQVTSFKCGGFAMGLCTNHTTLDGLGVKNFLDNLAALAAGGLLVVPPSNDRRLLAARSPPRVTFPHPELLHLPPSAATAAVAGDSPANVFKHSPENLDFRIFRLSSGQISDLKDKAKLSAAPGAKISSFDVVAAHIWRCKALSALPSEQKASDGGDPAAAAAESMMLYAVDIRRRVRPELPAGYAGNAVLSAYARAGREELGEAARLGDVVARVVEGAARMTEEYVRSVVDWGEVNKGGFPLGDFLISSWWRLGFGEVEYPWGRPRYSCPVVCRRKDVILLFPDAAAASVGEGVNGGVNVLVALPSKEMLKFEALFHKFLLLP